MYYDTHPISSLSNKSSVPVKGVYVVRCGTSVTRVVVKRWYDTIKKRPTRM